MIKQWFSRAISWPVQQLAIKRTRVVESQIGIGLLVHPYYRAPFVIPLTRESIEILRAQLNTAEEQLTKLEGSSDHHV